MESSLGDSDGVLTCTADCCHSDILIIINFLFPSLSDDQLKEFLMEGSDFALLPQLAWEKMVSWYGLSQGSIPIPRWVWLHCTICIQSHQQRAKSC